MYKKLKDKFSVNVKNIVETSTEKISQQVKNVVEKTTNKKIIKIKLSEIKFLPELEKAFRMDNDVKNRVKEDMAINGFSNAHPIHIFKYNNAWVLVDGHTRYKAASELGLKYVWAQIHYFENVNQALLYSMQEQFNRRNIEDSELFKQFELLQEEYNGKKLTSAEKAEKLHKSKRHIYKMEEVKNKASPKQLDDIRSNKTSINKVYNEIKEAEAKKQKTEAKQEIINTDFINKQKLENVSTKSIEDKILEEQKKAILAKQRELDKRELTLKSRAKEKISKKDILILGIKYAFKELSKGRNIQDILSDKVVTDFNSPDDIVLNNEGVLETAIGD